MDMRQIAVIGFAVLTIFGVDRATAHPLGNFSISHYSAIGIGKDAVELRYIIDMAEIPTFQEIQENRITVDAEDVTVQAYLTRKAEILRDGLSLQVGGKPLRLCTSFFYKAQSWSCARRIVAKVEYTANTTS